MKTFFPFSSKDEYDKGVKEVSGCEDAMRTAMNTLHSMKPAPVGKEAGFNEYHEVLAQGKLDEIVDLFMDAVTNDSNRPEDATVIEVLKYGIIPIGRTAEGEIVCKAYALLKWDGFLLKSVLEITQADRRFYLRLRFPGRDILDRGSTVSTKKEAIEKVRDWLERELVE